MVILLVCVEVPDDVATFMSIRACELATHGVPSISFLVDMISPSPITLLANGLCLLHVRRRILNCCHCCFHITSVKLAYKLVDGSW